MTTTYGARLFPQHQEVLRARAVPPDLAEERGYVSVDGVAQLRRLGFEVGSPPVPGLAIPRYTTEGERSAPQFRPDRPRVTAAGKERKYEAPMGAGNFVDVHPRCRPTLADAAVPLVVSCEGTLKADALLAHLGAAACVVSISGVTCWKGSVGTSGARTTVALPDWNDLALRGRLVHLACDSDYTSNDKVRAAVTALARYLEIKGAGVRVVYPPPGPGDTKLGWDDYLANGGSWAVRLAEIGAVDDDDEPAGRPSQATQLVRSAQAAYRFGMSQNGEPFAVAHNGPNIARMLRGGDSLRAELAAGYAAEHGRAPSSSALADTLLVLEGRAVQSGREPLALRVGSLEGGMIVLDLGDETGRAVTLEPGRWTVVDRSPLLFRRTALTAALPTPISGGNLDDLGDLLNVTDEAWPLVLGWLVAALLPEIPHPIPLLTGEQGVGKSTAARFLAGLIDPSPAQLWSPPRDLEAWAVAASGSYVVALDNLSGIRPWLSDALCRAVTGDGVVRRRLYENESLTVLAFRRCVILTAIDAGALRGDLGDRLLVVELEQILRRRNEAAIVAEFHQAHPAILGAILDLAAKVLTVLPDVHLDRPPRMSDFAHVLGAVDAVLDTDAVDQYRKLGRRIAEDVVDGDMVASAVRRHVDAGPWTGTAADLLQRLSEALPNPDRPPPDWPRTPRGLAGALRSSAPALRALAVQVEFDRGPAPRRERIIRLTQTRDTGEGPSTPSTPSSEEPDMDGMDGRDGPVPPSLACVVCGEPCHPDHNPHPGCSPKEN